MAQKDFTEILAEYVPDRIFFSFQTDFLILQSVSIFKYLLWELDRSGSEISVNKSQPRGQHLLEVISRVPQFSHALAGTQG